MKKQTFCDENILITGGSGLVGSYLKEIMSSKQIYISSADYDLCNIFEVSEMMNKYKPNTIIHLAARVGGITENIKYPVEFLEQNIQMNTNILQEAHKHNVKNLIGIISTCAYPDVSNRYPMTEDELFNGPPQSTNFSYAMSKRILAAHIDAYNKEYNKNWCYLIPCNLYGKYDKFDSEKSHFLSALIKKIIDTDKISGVEKEIKLLGTGKSLRQFMYARDLARIIMLILERNIYTNMNVAPNYEYSIKEMTNIALNVLHKDDINVEFDLKASLDGQYRKSVSVDKLLKYFPDFEFTSLTEGIKIVYDYKTKK